MPVALYDATVHAIVFLATNSRYAFRFKSVISFIDLSSSVGFYSKVIEFFEKNNCFVIVFLPFILFVAIT